MGQILVSAGKKCGRYESRRVSHPACSKSLRTVVPVGR